MKTLIKGGRLIDPASNTDEIADILLEEGKIVQIGGQLAVSGPAEVIDAAGMWVTPGLIDMHVHLRDPGQHHKETIATGTKAAAAGGFTTVCCMPNTAPVIDNESVVEYVIGKAEKEGIIHVIPVGSITKGLDGKELSSIEAMKNAGICAISDDGKTVENPGLFKSAMECAAKYNLPVLSHCDDPEGEIIERDILLAQGTGARLHICHVSTAEGLAHIKKARHEGQPVTAEVTPHHFTLIAEEKTSRDANYKMSPPLRSEKDRDAVINALKDGTIGVIATDHAPHHEDEKNCGYEKAMNGVIGLETAVSLCISELIEPGILTPAELIAKLTINPAKILGLDKGHLGIGAAADITIIDPAARYVTDKNTFQSLSRNTPFHGREVVGRVVYTIAAGKVLYEKGEILC